MQIFAQRGIESRWWNNVSAKTEFSGIRAELRSFSTCHPKNSGSLKVFLLAVSRGTVKVFLEFLDRLVRQQAGRKVFLIVDHHAVRKSTKVAKWLTENEDKIHLFFLPAYSPELNPDELLNQGLKSNAFRQGRAKDKQDMMSKARAFLRSKQRRSGKVRKYFDGPKVAYAAAA